MKISIIKIMFLALTLILIPRAAGAQTPDGVTPAEENYCDQYSGRKFGICNAWYEAMDCDSSGLTHASQVACDKLKSMLDNLDTEESSSGETAIPCPCFSDLNTVFNRETSECSPLDNPTLVTNGDGSQVQAFASSTFNACIGTDGVIKMDITLEEATSCVNLLGAFCALQP